MKKRIFILFISILTLVPAMAQTQEDIESWNSKAVEFHIQGNYVEAVKWWRKAAEQGGVHPIYIDRISSKFASKIETLSSIKAVPELMGEIFSTYCRLVRKHTTKQYSPIVKKTVLMIDSDISAELSLNTLAKKQGISAGYLATVFKRETGKTVSEYVRDRRINHALHLLATTNLQIQTVAMHCGIMDVQYFSKLFKKQLGKTPREYRDSLASK